MHEWLYLANEQKQLGRIRLGSDIAPRSDVQLPRQMKCSICLKTWLP